MQNAEGRSEKDFPKMKENLSGLSYFKTSMCFTERIHSYIFLALVSKFLMLNVFPHNMKIVIILQCKI